MNNIKELIKLAADSMKNRTLSELLKNDKEYQERVEEEKRAYHKLEILDLTEEQRSVVDMVIARKEEAEFDYRVNAYMAGMLDAYEILKQFDLTRG